MKWLDVVGGRFSLLGVTLLSDSIRRLALAIAAHQAHLRSGAYPHPDLIQFVYLLEYFIGVLFTLTGGCMLLTHILILTRRSDSLTLSQPAYPAPSQQLKNAAAHVSVAIGSATVPQLRPQANRRRLNCSLHPPMPKQRRRRRRRNSFDNRLRQHPIINSFHLDIYSLCLCRCDYPSGLFFKNRPVRRSASGRCSYN